LPEIASSGYKKNLREILVEAMLKPKIKNNEWH